MGQSFYIPNEVPPAMVGNSRFYCLVIKQTSYLGYSSNLYIVVYLMSYASVSCALQEISGPSIMMALGSLMRKPGFSSLPQSYMKAGATLFVSLASNLNISIEAFLCGSFFS